MRFLWFWRRAKNPTQQREEEMERAILQEVARTRQQREEAEAARRRLEATIELKRTVSAGLLPRAAQK